MHDSSRLWVFFIALLAASNSLEAIERDEGRTRVPVQSPDSWADRGGPGRGQPAAREDLARDSVPRIPNQTDDRRRYHRPALAAAAAGRSREHPGYEDRRTAEGGRWRRRLREETDSERSDLESSSKHHRIPNQTDDRRRPDRSALAPARRRSRGEVPPARYREKGDDARRSRGPQPRTERRERKDPKGMIVSLHREPHRYNTSGALGRWLQTMQDNLSNPQTRLPEPDLVNIIQNLKHLVQKIKAVQT